MEGRQGQDKGLGEKGLENLEKAFGPQTNVELRH